MVRTWLEGRPNGEGSGEFGTTIKDAMGGSSVTLSSKIVPLFLLSSLTPLATQRTLH